MLTFQDTEQINHNIDKLSTYFKKTSKYVEKLTTNF